MVTEVEDNTRVRVVVASVLLVHIIPGHHHRHHHYSWLCRCHQWWAVKDLNWLRCLVVIIVVDSIGSSSRFNQCECMALRVRVLMHAATAVVVIDTGWLLPEKNFEVLWLQITTLQNSSKSGLHTIVCTIKVNDIADESMAWQVSTSHADPMMASLIILLEASSMSTMFMHTLSVDDGNNAWPPSTSPQCWQWPCIIYIHLCSPSMMMTSTTSPSVMVDDNDRHPQKLSQQYNIGMTISNHAWRHSDTYIRFLLSSWALSTPPTPFPFAPSMHPIPGYNIHSQWALCLMAAWSWADLTPQWPHPHLQQPWQWWRPPPWPVASKYFVFLCTHSILTMTTISPPTAPQRGWGPVIMNKFTSSLKLYFTQYCEVSAFAQFGSDLVASELLKQGLYQPLPIHNDANMPNMPGK